MAEVWIVLSIYFSIWMGSISWRVTAGYLLLHVGNIFIQYGFDHKNLREEQPK